MADSFLGGQTMAIAKMALDAYTLRHQAIASNIANIHSDGYRALRVSFEDQLGMVDFSTQGAERKLAGVTPRLEEEPAQSGVNPGVALDMEVVRLNQNTLNFQALVSAMGKSMSLVGIAARDGKS